MKSIIRDDFNWRDFIVASFGGIFIMIPVIKIDNLVFDVLWLIFSMRMLTIFLQYKKKSRKNDNVKVNTSK